jgi:transposase
LNFWQEASQGQDDYGRPVFLPGDVVIVDNCAIHHNQAERVLSNFFGLQGIDYGFLPTYSPDFNPVENCFGKIKKILSQERFNGIVGQNMKFAITQVIKEISQSDLIRFYRHTGYLDV